MAQKQEPLPEPVPLVQKTRFEKAWERMNNSRRNDYLAALAQVFTIAQTQGKIKKLPHMDRLTRLDPEYVLELTRQAQKLVDWTTLTNAKFDNLRSTFLIAKFGKMFERWAAQTEKAMLKAKPRKRRESTEEIHARLLAEATTKRAKPKVVKKPVRLKRYASVEKTVKRIAGRLFKKARKIEVYAYTEKGIKYTKISFYTGKVHVGRAEQYEKGMRYSGYEGGMVSLLVKGEHLGRDIKAGDLERLFAQVKVMEATVGLANRTRVKINIGLEGVTKVATNMGGITDITAFGIAMEFMFSKKKQDFYANMSKKKREEIAKQAGAILGTKVQWYNPAQLFVAVAAAQKKMGMRDVDNVYGVDGLWGSRTNRRFKRYAKRHKIPGSAYA